jgi:agmatinase
MGSLLITSEAVHRLGVEAVLAGIPAADTIYMTIDIDVVDPSLAPGTGTPEVGGLSFQEIDGLVMGLARKGKLVGLDVVEVAPSYDPTGVTAQLAARLIIDVLGAALPR